MPATITLQPAAIGGVMASYTASIGHDWVTEYICDTEGGIWGMGAFTTNLMPIDQGQGLYESGLTGIGIRLRFSAYSPNFGPPKVAPFELHHSSPTIPLPFSNRLLVEFVRTGIAVGKGDITPFDIKTDYHIATIPQTRIAIQGTQLKTRLTHNVYFTSCHNPSSDPVVNMGRPHVALVKQGEVPEHNFSLDIRCDGMNPTTKPPVKIYFEGNAVRDGLLRLNGDGQAGVAKGVGIALSDDKGVALPFSRTKALPLAWQSSAPDAEFYRFAGKARYTGVGGEITAGKADAVLTYVLDYN